MGMPLELNTLIITKGKERRLEENLFHLEKQGYRLYPIDIPIDVRKTLDGESHGTGLIKRVEWQDNKTFITYQLVALNTTN